jgi:hypothetical protein
MHQEHNVAESIISMSFDFIGFMKDNIYARKKLADLCDHPSFEARANPWGNLTRPRVPYYFKSKERKEILKWLKTLKFPDRYATNIK